MSVSYEQTNIVPGGRGKRSWKSTITHCHYKSYSGGLKNEVSVIVPTNFGEGCSFQMRKRGRVNVFIQKEERKITEGPKLYTSRVTFLSLVFSTLNVTESLIKPSGLSFDQGEGSSKRKNL